MSEWSQPWHRHTLDGRPCRLQIVDPQTAFELEPQLIERLGEPLALALAAPEHILGAVWSRSLEVNTHGETLGDALAGSNGPAVVADGLCTLARLLVQTVAAQSVDPDWLAATTRALLVGRLEVDGELVDDWRGFPLRAVGRWQALAAQLRQTFGPLWLRSPYRIRSTAAPSDVPAPTDVPIAVRWADTLATQGRAGSAVEVIREWTPIQVIQVVESAAYAAEVERRAYAAAKGGDP